MKAFKTNLPAVNVKKNSDPESRFVINEYVINQNRRWEMETCKDLIIFTKLSKE